MASSAICHVNVYAYICSTAIRFVRLPHVARSCGPSRRTSAAAIVHHMYTSLPSSARMSHACTNSRAPPCRHQLPCIVRMQQQAYQQYRHGIHGHLWHPLPSMASIAMTASAACQGAHCRPLRPWSSVASIAIYGTHLTAIARIAIYGSQCTNFHCHFWHPLPVVASAAM